MTIAAAPAPPPQLASATPNLPRHIPALDGIRGLAILAVMLFHVFKIPLDPAYSAASRITILLARTGYLGVDLFFVLSGFLITGILLDSLDDPHYFRNFYMRRSLRIFPLYFGALFLFFGVIRFIRPDLLNGIQALGKWLATYLYNIMLVRRGYWYVSNEWFDFGHFWSLAVEEHFYFVWPALVLFFRGKRLIRLSCAIIALAALSKCAFWCTPRGFIAGYVFTLCRADSLAIGCIACVSLRYNKTLPFTRLYACLAAASLLAIAFSGQLLTGSFVGQFVGSPAAAFLFALLIRAAARPGKTAVFFSPFWLRWLGKYSYGLYVWHGILIISLFRLFAWCCDRYLAADSFLYLATRALFVITISCVIAYLSYHLYEKPFLLLKKFFHQDRRHAAHAAA